MNCCDDYGNCRQGRDCPVRKSRQMGEPKGTFIFLLAFITINTLLVALGVVKFVELFV